MNNQLKKLIEKIIEIMKEEGIKWINIRSNGHYSAKDDIWVDDGDYSIDMSFNKRTHKATINTEEE